MNNYNLHPIETQEDFTQFLKDERVNASSLRDAILKDVGNQRISVLKEKKVFMQSLIMASITLLGFVSVFFTISGNRQIYHPYYLLIGIGLHLFLVCFVAIYLKDYLDKDINGLLRYQDHVMDLFNEKILFVESYYLGFIKDKVRNIPQHLTTYTEQLKKLPSVIDLKNQNDTMNKEKDERKNNKSNLEFSGEIAVFCFVLGTILIFSSSLNFRLTFLNEVFILIIILWLTFSDTTKIWTILSRVLTAVTTRDLLKNKSHDKNG